MNVIFVLFKTVAPGQILLENRHHFVGLRLEEVKRFNKPLKKRIDGFFILLDIICGGEQSRVMNYRPVREIDHMQSFFDAVEIERHVDQRCHGFAGNDFINEI